MKQYKIKCKKYGFDSYDIVKIKAKDFDHLCLLAEDFCRKSTMYSTWNFIGEEDEI